MKTISRLLAASSLTAALSFPALAGNIVAHCPKGQVANHKGQCVAATSASSATLGPKGSGSALPTPHDLTPNFAPPAAGLAGGAPSGSTPPSGSTGSKGSASSLGSGLGCPKGFVKNPQGRCVAAARH